MPALFKTALSQWAGQVTWFLEYDPMWFPEFGFSISAVGWGVFTFLTPDFLVRGGAYALPIMAIVLGIVRSYALMRLWYAGRVLLCAASALLAAWLWWSLAARFGPTPMMGYLIGPFVIEVLIASRFSIPCARELRAEFVSPNKAA